jgi:hypothetical protein
MQDMGIDEDGTAVIEAEITAIWDGQARRWARGLLRGGWEGHILYDGCLS